MVSRAALDNIHIVNVTKDGKDAGFGSLCDKLTKLSPEGFVAIDTEFSGLGKDVNLSHEDLKLRYDAIRKLADSRAIFSVGLSLFCPTTSPTNVGEGGDQKSIPTPQTYDVATYDFLMGCQDDYETNMNAGSFLVAHKFDFKRMFQKGIPYARASTEKPLDSEEGKSASKDSIPWRWGKMPRGLLWRIGRQGVPLIVHNGFMDLALLFAAFQGPLPLTLHGFVSALLECIPAGYWDSKMLAFAGEERASFLGYLFAKSVVSGFLNVSNALNLPRDDVTDPSEEDQLVSAGDTLCALYAFKGFCHRGTACPMLHDPFLILDAEKKGKLSKDSKQAQKNYKVQVKELKRRKSALKAEFSSLNKKRKKKFLEQHRRTEAFNNLDHSVRKDPMNMEEPASMEKEKEAVSSPMETGDLTETDMTDTTGNVASRNEKKVHTAGWDAFCTGYVFAAYRAGFPPDKLKKVRNRIALQRKSEGLLLCKSQFADLDEKSA